MTGQSAAVIRRGISRRQPGRPEPSSEGSASASEGLVGLRRLLRQQDVVALRRWLLPSTGPGGIIAFRPYLDHGATLECYCTRGSNLAAP